MSRLHFNEAPTLTGHMQVKLMFDQYEEHGINALDAKQLQVPLSVTLTTALHSPLLQVGLSSIGMFLGNSDTHQLLAAIGSSGANGCIAFTDIA